MISEGCTVVEVARFGWLVGMQAMYWLYDNTVFMITHKLSDYDARKATTRSGLSW